MRVEFAVAILVVLDEDRPPLRNLFSCFSAGYIVDPNADSRQRYLILPYTLILLPQFPRNFTGPVLGRTDGRKTSMTSKTVGNTLDENIDANYNN